MVRIGLLCQLTKDTPEKLEESKHRRNFQNTIRTENYWSSNNPTRQLQIIPMAVIDHIIITVTIYILKEILFRFILKKTITSTKKTFFQ